MSVASKAGPYLKSGPWRGDDLRALCGEIVPSLSEQ